MGMSKRNFDSDEDIYDHSQEKKIKNAKSNPSLPGRAPKRPDSQLSTHELEKRNRRRQCNREAAERQRDRRIRKVLNLEDQVAGLKTEKEKLTEENDNLKEELKKLKFQLKMANGSTTQASQPMQIVQPVQYVQTMPQTMVVPLTPTNLVFADSNSEMFTTANHTFQFPTKLEDCLPVEWKTCSVIFVEE